MTFWNNSYANLGKRGAANAAYKIKKTFTDVFT
jgi:hypothetical protein